VSDENVYITGVGKNTSERRKGDKGMEEKKEGRTGRRKDNMK
jgi:hypothetical protein